ncbi:MAG: T9SS type A sorting domain-containing protein, partial [bacterium]
YQFKIDTAFDKTLHPLRYKALDVAIKQWVCLSNVNFSLGDTLTPPVDSARRDGICMIQFGKTPIGTIAYTYQRKKIGCALFFGAEEVDIIIDEKIKDSLFFSLSCYDSIPPYKYDFMYTILHELGHAHSLNHINHSSKIMYWLHDNIVHGIPSGNRNVFISYDLSASGGSQYVMDRATDPAFLACTLLPPMTPTSLLQCDTLPFRLATPRPNNTYSCSLISVNEIETEFKNFKIFPNPVENDISMTYYSEQPARGEIFIYDIYGKVLSRTKYKSIYGENKTSINVVDLQPGVYCIGVKNESGNKVFYKFIKQ